MPQSQQEKIVSVSYSQLGETTDTWGNNLVTREDGTQEYTSTYTDLRLINRYFTQNLIKYLPQNLEGKLLRFADFGGGDGFLARTIRRQLLELSYNSIGLSIDKELKLGKTRQSYEENLKQNPKAGNRVFPIAKDFTSPTEINIRANSLQFALLRNVLQYCGENKSQMFDSVSKYVTQNGILITQTPICNQENQSKINNFWAEFAQIMQGLDIETSLNSHYFPTLEEIEIYGKQSSLEVVESCPATHMPFKVSEENTTNGSRFEIPNDDQKAQIQTLFQKYFQSDHYFHIPGVVVFRKG